MKRRRSGLASSTHGFLSLCATVVLIAWFINGLLTRDGFALALAGIAIVAVAVWVADCVVRSMRGVK